MSVVTALGAGVRHRRRWLFRDLDVTVEPGEIVAVVGPPGSGRTTLLLALADRFRLSAGKVTVSGTAVLGYVPEVEAPEPVFTVAEHVRERLALLGRHRADAAGVPLHGLDPAAPGRDLTPYQKQVLGLILAGLSRPDMVALDGLDAGLDAAEQSDLWRLLADIAAAGTAVLVTAREVDPARVATVIRLDSPRHPTTRTVPHEQPEASGLAEETGWSRPAPVLDEPAAAAGSDGGVAGLTAEDGVGPVDVTEREPEARVADGVGPPTVAGVGAPDVPGDEPAADDAAGTADAAGSAARNEVQS